MTSAMPDMPMPPMPTKWIVPRSVPSAFMREHPDGSFSPDAGRQAEPDLDRSEAVADPLDEVGEVARGVRAPDRNARAAALIRDCGSSAITMIWRASTSGLNSGLRDRPRTARIADVASVRSLMIVGRRWIRDQDCGPSSRSQLRNGRRARARNHQMRFGELGRHVLDVGHQLGRDSQLGIAGTNRIDVVRPALLHDLQASRSDAGSRPSPSGTTLLKTVAPWLPPVTRILNGAYSSKGGNGTSPSCEMASRTGLPTSTVFVSKRGFNRSTSV